MSMLKDFKRILLLLFIIYSCSENIFSQEYFYEYGKHEDLQLTFTLRDAILENEILYMTLSFTNEDAKKPSIDMINESVLCIWLYANNSKEAKRIYVGDRVSQLASIHVEHPDNLYYLKPGETIHHRITIPIGIKCSSLKVRAAIDYEYSITSIFKLKNVVQQFLNSNDIDVRIINKFDKNNKISHNVQEINDIKRVPQEQ